MSRIYTRQGDKGQTGYLGKGRIAKDQPRIEAVGCLDEVNCAVGIVLADAKIAEPVQSWLLRVQNDLFEAGAAIASADPKSGAEFLRAETAWLEEIIDQTEQGLPSLDCFILPGGSPAGARLHWIRTLCRRTERSLVTACRDETDREPLLAYINRLSDAFFVLARRVNQIMKTEETPWTSSRS